MKQALCVFLLLVISVFVCAACAETIDGANDRLGAIPLQLSVEYIAQLDESEQDWYSCTAEADPAYYRIHMTNVDINTTLYMELFDENGLSLCRTDAGNGNSNLISWKIPAGKTYAFVFYPNNDSKSGQYRIDIQKIPDAQPNDQANAVAIAPGESVLSSLDGTGDVDWFALTADDDPAYYRFDMVNVDIDTTLYMELFDENGLSLCRTDAGNNAKNWLSWKIPAGKTYGLKFYPYYEYKRGQYRLSVTKFADAQPNDQANAVAIAPGESVLSSLDGTGDVDWFALTADDDPAYYRFDMVNVDIDTTLYMELFDENGLSLCRTDAGNNAKNWLSWKIPAGKTYGLAFYPNKEYRRGQYRLSVTKTIDAQPNDQANAVAIAPGESVLASLDGTGDVDWFALTTGEETAYYRFDMVNVDIDTTLYMELFDENGLSLCRTDAGKDGQCWFSYKIPAGKTYSVIIYPYKNKVGQYRLKAEQHIDSEPDTLGEAIALVPGAKTAGSLDGTGDVDWFAIAEGGEAAYCRIDISNLSVNSTLYAELYDSDGLKLDRVDMNTEKSSWISCKMDVGMTYYLVLFPYDSSRTGDYQVCATLFTDAEPDSQNEALPLTNGQTTEATLDGADDIDWFSFTAPEELCWTSIVISSLDKNITLALYDNGGAMLTDEYVYAQSEETIKFQPVPGAVYGLMVYGENDANARKYKITLNSAADAGGNSTDSALQLGACETAQLYINTSKDADYVAIPAGAFVRVTALSADIVYAAVDGSDYYTYIYNGDSEVLEFAEAGYLNITGETGEYEVTYCLPDSHISGTSKVEREATCTEKGERVTKCQICGAVTETEYLEKLAHIPADEWRVLSEATCTDAGERVLACDVCGEILERESMPVLEHAHTAWYNELEVTCLVDGIQSLVCEDCGKVLERERIASVGHISSVPPEITPAGCEVSGKERVYCVVCGETLEETEIPPTGHSFGEWVVVKKATKQEKGERQRVCEYCGAVESEAIDKVPWWHF